MEITFYNNASEPNKVDKDLTAVGTRNCKLREATSILFPQIEVESETPITANYAYIPDFNRYYFVKETHNVQRRIWVYDLAVDVLTTYKTPLKECQATLDRQEFQYNLYLPDDKWDAEADTFTITNRIGTGAFDNGNIVLLLANCRNIE